MVPLFQLYPDFRNRYIIFVCGTTWTLSYFSCKFTNFYVINDTIFDLGVILSFSIVVFPLFPIN